MEGTKSLKVHFKLIQDSDDYPPVGVESVWVQPGGSENEYVVDNVPFFITEATLGDTILVREDTGSRWFETVVRASDNSLVRVVFLDRDCVSAVDARLKALGCTTEYMKEYNILAVNIPAATSLTDLQAYLQIQHRAGRIDYEEPLLRQ